MQRDKLVVRLRQVDESWNSWPARAGLSKQALSLSCASSRVTVWRLTGVPPWSSSKATRDADHLRRIDSICSTSLAGVSEGGRIGADERSSSPRSPYLL
jgi:hypothetical protein